MSHTGIELVTRFFPVLFRSQKLTGISEHVTFESSPIVTVRLHSRSLVLKSSLNTVFNNLYAFAIKFREEFSNSYPFFFTASASLKTTFSFFLSHSNQAPAKVNPLLSFIIIFSVFPCSFLYVATMNVYPSNLSVLKSLTSLSFGYSSATLTYQFSLIFKDSC